MKFSDPLEGKARHWDTKKVFYQEEDIHPLPGDADELYGRKKRTVFVSI